MPEEPKTDEKPAEPKAAATAEKAEAKPASTGEKAPAEKAPAKKTPAKKAPAKKAPAKKAPAKKAAAKDEASGDEPAAKSDVKIVDEPSKDEKPAPREHKARIKPELDDATREALNLRNISNAKRPGFRRQQWFEYKRLSRTGWRKPTGQDSKMRRNFGYRPPVVKVGFRGPKAARGLHPSGFIEVYVENPADLNTIDPKTQAVRFSARLGKRKLRTLYEAADEKKIRVLNRREI